MSVLVCTSNAGKLREFEAALDDFGPVFGLSKLPATARARHQEPVEDGESFVHNGLKKLATAWQAFGSERESLGFRYILVDDSGLCVQEMDFKPGVHSVFYAGPTRDDRLNRLKLAHDVDAHPRARSGVLGDRRLDGFFVCSLLCLDAQALASHPDGERWLCDGAEAPDAGQAFPGQAWENAGFQEVRREKRAFLVPAQTAANPGVLLPPFLKVVYGFVWGEVSSVEQQLLEGEGHGYDAIFFPSESPQLSFASIPVAAKNTLSHRGRAVQALRSQFPDGPNSSDPELV